jgi:hypothetical protein
VSSIVTIVSAAVRLNPHCTRLDLHIYDPETIQMGEQQW